MIEYTPKTVIELDAIRDMKKECVDLVTGNKGFILVFWKENGQPIRTEHKSFAEVAKKFYSLRESNVKPKAKEKWRLKTDTSKVLTVFWCGKDYVQFHAPWMKACKSVVTCEPNEHLTAGAKLSTFLKRYEPVI